MEATVGAADWLFGKVFEKLSDDLVKAYVASSELGLNFEKIETELMSTQGLLNAAQGRDVSDNPGLQGLLRKLSKKADEAEDALDELHYFIIQDQLDGTKHATPDLGDGLRGHAINGCHAVRHSIEITIEWQLKNNGRAPCKARWISVYSDRIANRETMGEQQVCDQRKQEEA